MTSEIKPSETMQAAFTNLKDMLAHGYKEDRAFALGRFQETLNDSDIDPDTLKKMVMELGVFTHHLVTKLKTAKFDNV